MIIRPFHVLAALLLGVVLTLRDQRAYGVDTMKTLEAKLTRIGNSRGIRLPAEMIRKHHLDQGVLLEERDGEIVLRPKNAPKKLTWEETARQMAASGEDWSDWESPKDGWDGE